MNINQTEKDNLQKGLGLFIEAIRLYIVALLKEANGDSWADSFAETLSDVQRFGWNQNIENGKAPENLIDFSNLKFFAIRNKELLKRDFGKKNNSLPNWFEEIAEVRNEVSHYQNDIDEDAATKCWINMKTIANILKMNELESELVKIKENRPIGETKTVTPTAKGQVSNETKPWFRTVIPHLDIRQGRLDESVFAANLAEVALGSGREIYLNPILFFQKTFFTSGLKSIAKMVVKGLNGNQDAENRVVSLQTGFGGGKTHTLISLYHLCKNGAKLAESESVRDLIAATGKPEFEAANIGVFTNTTNDPANGRKTSDGILIQTIWGELAYQLGGKEAYEIIRKNDEQLISPAGLFKKVLEKCKPALILIDELADYCVKASARTVGNSNLSDQTISFMQELTEAVSGTNNCVAIITLPASPQEVGNTAQAHQILSSLQSKVVRISSNPKPVADEEIYEVIRRRLFEEIGSDEQIEAVASKYIQTYQENRMELPAYAAQSDYKEKIRKSYPFHPELIDVFRIRWASNHAFQRTRGVLRLLASIVADVWQRRDSLIGGNLLIDAGDVNFSNLDSLSGQLKSLFGNGYDAVITADVSGSASNAFKIDETKPDYGNYSLAKGIASVVLLNSFGTDGANRGVTVKDIKLNLLEPEGFNHNLVNSALDEMEIAGHYLYYPQSGNEKRYWFHTKPNLNILINQVRNNIDSQSIEAEIIKRIGEKSRLVQPFNVLVHPIADVPEQQRPTLVILNPQFHADENSIAENTQKYIHQIATKKGNSERIYRNTMIFLSVTENSLPQLMNATKDFLACKKISDDYNLQLERDQKDDLRKKIEEAGKQADTALVVAYSTILKYSVMSGMKTLSLKQFRESLDGQINYNFITALKDEEWLLDSVGLGVLEKNNLLPTLTNPVKVKDVYEAFIRFDDKPMITSSEAIKKSLIKYCFEGQFCIASGDGKDFTKFYLKEGIPFLDVQDSNYWLVEKSLKPLPTPEPLVPGGDGQPTSPLPIPTPPIDSEPTTREFKSIEISGKIALENFHELFQCFIAPFATKGNKVEIHVGFKISSSESNVLTESNQQYKSAKEAAKQLGLVFKDETT
jgi:predicted AAA+ superfamily ATPase